MNLIHTKKTHLGKHSVSSNIERYSRSLSQENAMPSHCAFAFVFPVRCTCKVSRTLMTLTDFNI